MGVAAELIPVFYDAIYKVSMQNVGLIPAVMKNMNSVNRVAVGEQIQVPVGGGGKIVDGSSTFQLDKDAPIEATSVPVTLTKWRQAEIDVDSDSETKLDTNEGVVMSQAIQKKINLLNGEMELAIAKEITENSGLVYGTIGTLPFNTKDDLTDMSDVRAALRTAGAGTDNLRYVATNVVEANLLGKQTAVFKVNEAGGSQGREFGSIGRLFDFEIGATATEYSFAKGTAAGKTVDNAAGYPAGTTVFTIADGTGAFKKGDIITFGGVSGRYVVAADVLAGGTELTITYGIKEAVADDATITLEANRNQGAYAFDGSAVVLANRLPKSSRYNGSILQEVIEDPVSGVPYRFSVYPGKDVYKIVIDIVYGVKMINPAHAAQVIY